MCQCCPSSELHLQNSELIILGCKRILDPGNWVTENKRPAPWNSEANIYSAVKNCLSWNTKFQHHVHRSLPLTLSSAKEAVWTFCNIWFLRYYGPRFMTVTNFTAHNTEPTVILLGSCNSLAYLSFMVGRSFFQLFLSFLFLCQLAQSFRTAEHFIINPL